MKSPHDNSESGRIHFCGRQDKVTVIHVQSPGYEDDVSKRADRVVNQVQYQREVLVP